MTEFLSISRVIYKNKKRYERTFLYTEADGMDMTYFILHNLMVMKKAYEELKTYLARKMDERCRRIRMVTEQSVVCWNE